MGSGFYGSNDPTNSVKALKEETDRRAMTYSEREREFTFANKTWHI